MEDKDKNVCKAMKATERLLIMQTKRIII